ncbi:MAG TPA: tyrosine-type recombinase/integrase [Vicinamibacterales bacterium]|nr:tyrosine-type recombinase/integrase [Vicinamibacterales bacterium]
MSENTKKRRRTRGDGSIYRKRRMWWFAYVGPDGQRRQESSGSTVKEDAVRLLRRRTGAREHGLPVIANAEKLTFEQAAQAMFDDFKTRGRRSLDEAERRVRLHLLPFFGGRRIASIAEADVQAFVAHRREQGIVRKGERARDVSNGEINRELQHLKRILNIAVRRGQLGRRPEIAMLDERASVRTGFFEPVMLSSVLAHLPEELRPPIRMGSITGWRINSEVLPLEWRQVDMEAGEVRLDPGSTKNGEGRVFPFTAELRALFTAQRAAHDELKAQDTICPYVFFRMVADGRGGDKRPLPILSLNKAWQAACRAAGCPGRIPHDLRRTAVRNLVRSGVPERVAMKLTGHKTPSVFARYDIVSDGDLRDAAARLDLVSRGEGTRG